MFSIKRLTNIYTKEVVTHIHSKKGFRVRNKSNGTWFDFTTIVCVSYETLLCKDSFADYGVLLATFVDYEVGSLAFADMIESKDTGERFMVL